MLDRIKYWLTPNEYQIGVFQKQYVHTGAATNLGGPMEIRTVQAFTLAGARKKARQHCVRLEYEGFVNIVPAFAHPGSTVWFRADNLLLARVGGRWGWH